MVGDPSARERADATRNRVRVLAAAGELFATRGPRNVTMGDIAQAAGVGRATLYRRYADLSSIAAALLDEHERALQQKLIYGEPPLGPGAEPAERLAAFYAVMVDLLEDHHHLVLGTEIGQSRFAVGAYGFWRAHVGGLLAAAGETNRDAMVDLLLAPIAPDVYAFQRHGRGLTTDQISTALRTIAHRVLGKDR